MSDSSRIDVGCQKEHNSLNLRVGERLILKPDHLNNICNRKIFTESKSTAVNTSNKSQNIEPSIKKKSTFKQLLNNSNLPHVKKFNRIHAINIKFGMFVGFALSPTWKWNRVTTYCFCFLTLCCATHIYTIILARNNTAKLLEVISYFGISIPVVLKVHLSSTEYRQMLSAHDFVKKVFKLTESGAKADILDVHMRESFTSIKIFISLQTLAFAVFGFYPIYSLIIKHELYPFIAMDFPYVDQKTLVGYIIASIIAFKMALWIYVGNIAFDLFLTRLIYNYISLVKLLELDLMDFDVVMKSDLFTDNYKDAFLRNLLIKSQDRDNYIIFLNNIFSNVIFVMFVVLYISLTFVLYAILHNAWISGLGMFMFCLTEIYVLCALGTLIKNQNEHLCEIIYNVPWYDYSLSIQQTFLLLLHSSQNSMELWVGTLAPLNVETAMEITKSIYSTSTMIVNLE